jgi:hypothetical protein
LIRRGSHKDPRPEWAQKASTSLGRYYLAVNPGYSYVKYQQEEIIPAVEGLFRGDFDRLMIFIAAGHAKTDIATKAAIPYYFGQPKNENKNVMLITRAADLATRFGGHIRQVMSETAVYKAIFPHVTISKSTRAKDYFKTNLGQEFMAFGTDGGITGNRCDLSVMEDWIGNSQEAASEQVQSHLYDDIYKAVVRDRMRPGGKMMFITTRWGTRDTAARILEVEGQRWVVLVLQAQTHKPGCPDDDSCLCPYLWEEHFGRDFYDEFKRDRHLWLAKWQQSPKPLTNQRFEQEWLRFWLPEGSKSEYRENPVGPPTLIASPVDYRKLIKFNSYILVDPALGKEESHDRSAILVICAGPEGRLFWVDGVLDRLNPGERIDHLIRLCRAWRPRQIVYEEYAAQNDTYFLERALEAQGLTNLPGQDGGVMITSVGRKAKYTPGGRLHKHDRIMQLVPDFRDGRIWIPKRMVRTLLDGSKMDLVSHFINREYLPYAGENSIAHDDMLDCLSRIRDPEVYFHHVERDDDDEEYAGTGSDGGSWESRY